MTLTFCLCFHAVILRIANFTGARLSLVKLTFSSLFYNSFTNSALAMDTGLMILCGSIEVSWCCLRSSYEENYWRKGSLRHLCVSLYYRVTVHNSTVPISLKSLSDGPDRVHRRELFSAVWSRFLLDCHLHDCNRLGSFLHLSLASRLGRLKGVDVAAFGLRTSHSSQYSISLLQRYDCTKAHLHGLAGCFVCQAIFSLSPTTVLKVIKAGYTATNSRAGGQDQPCENHSTPKK